MLSQKNTIVIYPYKGWLYKNINNPLFSKQTHWNRNLNPSAEYKYSNSYLSISNMKPIGESHQLVSKWPYSVLTGKGGYAFALHQIPRIRNLWLSIKIVLSRIVSNKVDVFFKLWKWLSLWIIAVFHHLRICHYLKLKKFSFIFKLCRIII